jgi:MFS family permease
MMKPATDTPPVPVAKPETFPPGLHNIFIFNIFNSLSFQIVLGSPMVLYAKTLDASATVLGIVAGMMPLLVIFQIPAAKYLGRVGYKRFVFAGWGTRTMFIVGMALVPLTSGFLSAPTRMALVLMLLFCFNLARGITSCAWLPWISTLVPASLRGPYLVRDMLCQNVGGFMVFIISAFCLGEHPNTLRFAILFGFSAIMGGASLNFLRQVPEVEAPTEIKSSSTPVPWREIAAYPPFRKLVVWSLSWAVAYGGINTFVVAFLKTETSLPERDIMLVMSATFIGGLGSLTFLGSRLERLGSKPVLTFAILAWIGIIAGWVLISGRVLTVHIYSILGLLGAAGLFSSLVTMAQTRLAMAVVPPMGRDHFFALFSVLTNVTLGLSPIFWGLIIDGLERVHGTWHGLELNRFSLFFLMVSCCFLVAVLLSRRLEESKAATFEELIKDIFRQNPLRALRLWKQ